MSSVRLQKRIQRKTKEELLDALEPYVLSDAGKNFRWKIYIQNGWNINHI